MEPEASLVRIFTLTGAVVGNGFLVGEDTVLTCAHVIADALFIASDTSTKPETSVTFDFPLVLPGHKLTARVIFWQPIQANGGGDIAILQLDSTPPDGIQGTRLVIADDFWDHPFRTFGFPDRHDHGVWASGRLRAREATGWVQVEDIKTTGKRVQRGFSGGAIWDEQLDGVVGMVVAADEDASKVAYMIPTALLVKAFPELAQETIPPCPYRGLSAFSEQDVSFFFGREDFTEQLTKAVQKKPFVAVIGPSGCGKSSVVFAGLVPKLRSKGGWLIVSFRPSQRPLQALAATLIPLLETQMSETDRLVETNKLVERLIREELTLQDIIGNCPGLLE